MKKLPFFTIVLSVIALFLISCGKQYETDAESPPSIDAESSPSIDAGTPPTPIMGEESKPNQMEYEYYYGEIDTEDLLSHLRTLVKWVNSPVESLDDLEQFDLLFYAVERSADEGKTSGYRHGGISETSFSADVLAEYLFVDFFLDTDYLDRCKSINSGFKSPYYHYDSEEELFWVRMTNPSWWSGPFYTIFECGMEIHIEGHEIMVKTAIIAPDGEKKSADFAFTAITMDGGVFYRLVALDVYCDARYEQSALFKIDDFDFYTPWCTVYRDGDTKHISVMPSNGESWDGLSPRHPNVLLESYDEDWGYHSSGIVKCEIHKGVAYITFAYNGFADVYIYDIDWKTGHWMSGADDLAVFYAALREELQSSEGLEWNNCAFYRNFDIVTIAQAHDYALIRRSVSAWWIEGQYIMRNLISGEETFICGSYTVDYVLSYLNEYFKWISDDHLRIRVIENCEVDWAVVYDVVYDGQRWVVSESDEPYWELP